MYEDWKNEKIDIIIRLLEKRFPNIRACIVSKYASTPLSYRDYIGTDDGSIYGVRRDFRRPERAFIGPKTKVKNLLLTGQNLSHLHGVLGVSIAAISTCSEILGLPGLCQKIVRA
jgi:phytoene dehydrogenase-like protein